MSKRSVGPTSVLSGEMGRGVQAVNRALAILEVFSNAKTGLSLAQIAQRTGLYKSTILRLTESLALYGYLHRNEVGIFTVGAAPLRLASFYKRRLHPAELVMPVLRELASATEESAALYVLAGESRLCAYKVNSPRAVGDNVQQGDLLSLDFGAGGKILLSFTGKPGDAYEKIRARFYCFTRGERDAETAAIATPVFGADQNLEGALSVSGPIHRFTAAKVEAMRTQLFNSARKLTDAFGGDRAVYSHSLCN